MERDKQGNFRPIQYDGYGIKVFTRVKDFPYQFNALKSRCISILMSKGKPARHNPAPEDFREIRDELYAYRLRCFEKIKAVYNDLKDSNLLEGRCGDIYFPLLTVAKLVEETLFDKILNFARQTQREGREDSVDEWNKTLVKVLYEKSLVGSISSQQIREPYRDELSTEDLIAKTWKLKTQTITAKLKKLGFKRDFQKTTDRKTWFNIDKTSVDEKVLEYGLEPATTSLSPSKTHLSHLPHSDSLGEGMSLMNKMSFLEEYKDEKGPLSLIRIVGDSLENPFGLCLHKEDVLNLNSQIANKLIDKGIAKPIVREKSNDFCSS
jgi:hypothetical protein